MQDKEPPIVRCPGCHRPMEAKAWASLCDAGRCPRLVTLRSFRLKGVEDVEVNLGSLLNVKVRRARKQASRKRCCYQYVLFHLVSSVLL